MAKTEIKNKIRRLRFDHDEMTQQELANGVGVTRQTIIAIEAGKYAPSLTLAFRIARFFGVGVEAAIGYQERCSLGPPGAIIAIVHPVVAVPGALRRGQSPRRPVLVVAELESRYASPTPLVPDVEIEGVV